MKKISILFSLVLLASSCVKQMEEPESAKIAGMWAVVDDNDFTTKYIEFEHGNIKEYVSGSEKYYIADKSVWGCPEAGFKQLSSNRYSLVDGTLHYGSSHQKMRVDGETMTLADMKCRLVENFCPEYYSTINVSNLTQSFAFNGGGEEWSYNITQPVEGFVLKAKGPDWVIGLRVTADKISFTVPETTTTRTGIITLSYPSAEDLKISVTQRAAEINLDKASVTLGYTASSSSFTYSIPNQQAGYTLKVEASHDWITDVKNNDSSISFSVKENNSGSSRTGKITITYGGISKEFVVTQTYSATSIAFTPTSGSHDYTSGTYTFKYTISNPREGQEASVSTSDTWITGVSDSNGTVSYKVAENNSGSSRTGKITITYAGVSKVFTVTQSYTASDISLSPTSGSHDYTSGTYNFKYTISNPREGQEASVSTSDTWITGVSDSNGTVSYKVAENNSGSSRTGKITITYAGINKVFSVTQGEVLVNLSVSGTANCYVVSNAGSYYFKSVKGNSSTSVGTVSSVAVLWESFGTSTTPSVGDLVKSVSYTDGNIHFDTATIFKEGNAVIAAKNSSGTILWSWHIWFTDEPQGQEYYNNAGTMMDRNLGATSATPGDVGALGLLYQWGRKDPFLGSSSIHYDDIAEAKSTITWPSAVYSDSSTGTIAYATTNPTTFIRYKSSNYDWYYTGSESTDNTRWTTSDTDKSIYDPCPAGWRVPDGGSNGVWSKALGSSSYFNQGSLYNSTNEGMNFSGKFGSASTIWYPASGYRYGDVGSLNFVGDSGYYWSASPGDYYECSLFFIYNGYVYPSFNNYRALGHSVRCILESSIPSTPTEPSFVNLSVDGTANSYIISEAGTYKFTPTRGNSNQSVGSISKAEVLWETFGTNVTPNVGDLVKNVKYQNGAISFETPATFKEGNAVITAKDASGNILWSWHIWLTDEPQGQVYYNNAGTMMDRNLGATSATPGDVGALGLLYQWGRKDPFLGSSSIHYDDIAEAKSTITWPSAVYSDSSTGTIAYATTNPTTFIRYKSSNYDWYYTGSESTDNTRWTTSDTDKSIYDPCPSGWRVPDGGSNGVWSKALGSSSSFSYTYNSTNEGMNFSGKFGSASTIWYPASGCRYGNDDSLNHVGLGDYWSASPYDNFAYNLYFNDFGSVLPSNRLNRASGLSVRCLQESK